MSYGIQHERSDERLGTISSLQQVLMEEESPRARALAHLELGRLALNGGSYDLAVRHFREALMLDPRLERARRVLQELGEESTLILKRTERRRGLVRRLLSARRPDASQRR